MNQPIDLTRDASVSDSPAKVVDLLQSLHRLGQEKGNVSVGEVIECFGHRSYGPFLLVPALFGISPIGGIPGVPTFLALVVGLFAFQMLFGRTDLWLPAFLKKRSVTGSKLSEAADKLQSVGRWMDRLFEGRLGVLTREPFPRIAAAVTVLLCCLVPPLELLPFAVAGPMAVIGAFGIALMVSDGLLMLVALVGSGTVAWFVASSFWPF